MKPCKKHTFRLDGRGECQTCGKTSMEIFEEFHKKQLFKQLYDNDYPDALGGYDSIESWEEAHGRGFWGNSTTGYVYNKYNKEN